MILLVFLMLMKWYWCLGVCSFIGVKEVLVSLVLNVSIWLVCFFVFLVDMLVSFSVLVM